MIATACGTIRTARTSAMTTNSSDQAQHDVERRSARRSGSSMDPPGRSRAGEAARGGVRSVGVRAPGDRATTTAVAPSIRATRTSVPGGSASAASARALHTSPASLTRPPRAGRRSATTTAVAADERGGVGLDERHAVAQVPQQPRAQRERAGAPTSRAATTICTGTAAPSTVRDRAGEGAAGEHREDQVEREHLEDAEQRALPPIHHSQPIGATPSVGDGASVRRTLRCPHRY